jgi:hypothetical protein
MNFNYAGWRSYVKRLDFNDILHLLAYNNMGGESTEFLKKFV